METTTRKQRISALVNNYLIMVAIIVLCIITAVVEPKFVAMMNITSIMRSLVPLGMVALGMTFVIISGYIDLSVAGMFTVQALVCAMVYESSGSFWAALGTAVILGLVMGFINSCLLRLFGARSSSDALFISYGIGATYSGLAYVITGGGTIRIVPEGAARVVGLGTIGVFPVVMIIFLAFVIILQFVLKKLPVGREISLSGANRSSAELCGIRSGKIIAISYTLTGVLTAIGAFICMCRVGFIMPNIGKDYETNAILAVALGGTSMKGGHGGVVNTLLGVVLVMVLSNALIMLGIDENMEFVVKGLVLVAAILIDSRRAL